MTTVEREDEYIELLNKVESTLCYEIDKFCNENCLTYEVYLSWAFVNGADLLLYIHLILL